MVKKIVLGATLLGMGSAVMAGPSEGDIEITFTNLGANFSSGNDETNLNAAARAGKFLWGSNHEIGVGALFAYESNDVETVDAVTGETETDTVSDETLGAGAFYRYNWATSELNKWWYAGVDLDIGDLEESGDTLWLHPHVGHKWMLTDEVSFDLNGGLNIDLDNSDTDPTLVAQWGITVFFK